MVASCSQDRKFNVSNECLRSKAHYLLAGELTGRQQLLNTQFSIDGAGARQRASLSQPAAFPGASTSTRLPMPHCDGALVDRPCRLYQSHHVVLAKHLLGSGRRDVNEGAFVEHAWIHRALLGHLRHFTSELAGIIHPTLGDSYDPSCRKGPYGP